jgi:hypothetical protein
VPVLTPSRRRWGAVPYAWVQRLLATGRKDAHQGLWHFKLAFYLAARCRQGECKQSREHLLEGVRPDDRRPSRSTLYRGLQTLREAELVKEIAPDPGKQVSRWALFELAGCGPLKQVWLDHSDTEWFRSASPNTIRVLWALTLNQNVSKENKQASTWSSVRTLAEVSHLSERTVQTHLALLLANGVFEKQPPTRHRATPTYHWSFPDPVLLYHQEGGWDEMDAWTIAGLVEADPDGQHWCVEPGQQDVRPADEFEAVRHALVRRRFRRW